MKKLLAMLVLFLSTLNMLQAQDGYIKYLIDSEYRNKAVKVFKGEIVPFLNASKSNSINVIIGNDTITNLEATSKSYEVAPSPNEAYIAQKANYLQIKKDGFAWVNALTIPKTDTVTLISENGKRLTQLIEKREVQVNLSDLGKTCRLIISNSPSIFYSTTNLKHFEESESVQLTGITNLQATDKKETSWSWWYYALIVIAAVGIGLGVWRVFKSKMKQDPNEVRFTGNSLTEFANKYGGLEKLSSLNIGIIPTKSEWNRLKNNESAKAKKIKKLKGKRIIIHTDDDISFGFQGKTNIQSLCQSSKEDVSSKNISVQETNYGNQEELANQLRRMENNLITEIKRVGSGNNKSNDISRLKGEKEQMENKVKALETEKHHLVSTLEQLQKDKTTSESSLQTISHENNRVQDEIKKLKEKVIEVNYLREYCDSVSSYLQFCQQVSTDIYNFLNKIPQQNSKQGFSIGSLLINFQNSNNNIPVGNWLQIVKDINDAGVTTNKQLIRSFSQIGSDGEKLKEFQRLLFTEVLTKYSSNILILAEAFRNLSRFQVPQKLANEAQSTFGNHVDKFLRQSKTIGMEIKYVQLFKNFEDYLGQIESVDRERTLVYKEVSGLQKNEIAEIISFGIKTNFEDSKTFVILE